MWWYSFHLNIFSKTLYYFTTISKGLIFDSCWWCAFFLLSLFPWICKLLSFQLQQKCETTFEELTQYYLKKIHFFKPEQIKIDNHTYEIFTYIQSPFSTLLISSILKELEKGHFLFFYWVRNVYADILFQHFGCFNYSVICCDLMVSHLVLFSLILLYKHYTPSFKVHIHHRNTVNLGIKKIVPA